VDDGSADYTKELLEFYCESDSRIQFHQRPKNKRKGANACRNYGFELSKGLYIQWFDSDDLMLPDFLKIKVRALEENDVDFVISKSENFCDPNPNNIISHNEVYYLFDEYKITNYNYITQKINWLTYDFMGKRELCAKTTYNEELFSSQEYNFFCKITCYSNSCYIINEYLTRRRVHEDSIRSQVQSLNTFEKEKASDNINYETWKDIANLRPGTASEKYIIYKLIKINSRELPSHRILMNVCIILIRQKRIWVAFYMILYLHIYKITGRGNLIRKRLIKSISL